MLYKKELTFSYFTCWCKIYVLQYVCSCDFYVAHDGKGNCRIHIDSKKYKICFFE